MKILSGILRWVPRILAGILLSLTVLILTGVLNARVVLSNSMEPVIYKNDVVVGASWLTPEPGDIAIYKEREASSGQVKQDVVHRVITISSDGEFLFKGDNNQSEDALKVPRSDVMSVIVLKIPSVGGLFNPMGALAAVSVFGGLWAISYGVKNLRSSKHQDEK